jgi:hypothetical protein
MNRSRSFVIASAGRVPSHALADGHLRGPAIYASATLRRGR